MRWLDPPPEAPLTPDGLLKRLVDEIAETTGIPPAVKRVDLDALADALRLAWTPGNDPRPDRLQVIRLSARTFSALGSGAMARQLVLFGSGLVRPCVWEISGGRRMWVLDVQPLFPGEGAPLELTLFQALEAAIAGMAEVWDVSAGQGLLAIRNLGPLVDRLVRMPGSRGRKRRAALLREVLRASQSRLENLAPTRGWRQTPDVIHLGAS